MGVEESLGWPLVFAPAAYSASLQIWRPNSTKTWLVLGVFWLLSKFDCFSNRKRTQSKKHALVDTKSHPGTCQNPAIWLAGRLERKNNEVREGSSEKSFRHALRNKSRPRRFLVIDIATQRYFSWIENVFGLSRDSHMTPDAAGPPGKVIGIEAVSWHSEWVNELKWRSQPIYMSSERHELDGSSSSLSPSLPSFWTLYVNEFETFKVAGVGVGVRTVGRTRGRDRGGRFVSMQFEKHNLFATYETAWYIWNQTRLCMWTQWIKFTGSSENVFDVILELRQDFSRKLDGTGVFLHSTEQDCWRSTPCKASLPLFLVHWPCFKGSETSKTCILTVT